MPRTAADCLPFVSQKPNKVTTSAQEVSRCALRSVVGLAVAEDGFEAPRGTAKGWSPRLAGVAA